MGFAEAWTDLTEFHPVDAWNALISDIPSQTVPQLTSVAPQAAGEALDAIPTPYVSTMSDFIAGLSGAVTGFVARPIFSEAADFFTGIETSVENGISTAYNDAASVSHSVIDTIMTPVTTIKNAVATGTSITKYALYLSLAAVLLAAYNHFPKYRILTFIAGGLIAWHLFLKPNDNSN